MEMGWGSAVSVGKVPVYIRLSPLTFLGKVRGAQTEATCSPIVPKEVRQILSLNQ